VPAHAKSLTFYRSANAVCSRTLIRRGPHDCLTPCWYHSRHRERLVKLEVAPQLLAAPSGGHDANISGGALITQGVGSGRDARIIKSCSRPIQLR